MESNNIELITRMVIQAINQNEKKGDGFMVPIGVSARHIHLTQEHVEALFGPGYQLTKKKELMGGQFASNETVTIVGLKLRAIENVRILGPGRNCPVFVLGTDHEDHFTKEHYYAVGDNVVYYYDPSGDAWLLLGAG